MAVPWNTENAAHLLRRAGFEPTPKEVAKAEKRGLDKTLAKLLKPAKSSGKLPKKADRLDRMQTWWIKRLVTTKTPLAEKLTLFWHNHFATAISKVSDRDMMFRHVATLREHALGSFRDMLFAMATDPAMLIWLDNKDNVAENPNENFARELMELFTTGIIDQEGSPNYTEADVNDVARAFTGWTLQDGEFVFRDDLHDFGTKTIKGLSGNFDGDDVLDLLLNDAATARRIPWKLWNFLAHPVDLDDPIIDAFEAVYVQTNGQLGAVVEAILRSDAFYSDTAKSTHVRNGMDWLVSCLRVLQAKVKGGYPEQVGDAVQQVGMSVFDPPSVFGWDDDLAWVGTSGMLARIDVADWITEQRDKKSPVKYKPHKLLGKKGAWKDMDAAAVVSTVLDALGVRDPSPTTVAALETYVAADKDGLPQPVVVDDEFVDRKVRGMAALVLGSPEFQIA